MGPCGAAVVAVVQIANLWNGDDVAERRWRDRPRLRRVLRQREMRSRLVVERQYRLKTQTQPELFHDSADVFQPGRDISSTS